MITETQVKRFPAPEAVRVRRVAPQQARQNVLTLLISRCFGNNAPPDPKQPEFGKRGAFELVVGKNFSIRRVVHCDQADLVEERNLSQFFRDADFILTIHRNQSPPRNLDVLVVIHGEILSVTGAGAERGHAEHVRDELEPAAVPGEDHRAGAGESLGFTDGQELAGGLADFVLDEAIRPGDPHGLDLRLRREAECERRAGIELLLIERSRPDFHFGGRCEL